MLQKMRFLFYVAFVRGFSPGRVISSEVSVSLLAYAPGLRPTLPYMARTCHIEGALCQEPCKCAGCGFCLPGGGVLPSDGGALPLAVRDGIEAQQIHEVMEALHLPCSSPVSGALTGLQLHPDRT